MICSGLMISALHSGSSRFKTWPGLLLCILGEDLCMQTLRTVRPDFISVYVAESSLKYFYSPLEGILIHLQVYSPAVKFVGSRLYTCVNRGATREKCPIITQCSVLARLAHLFQGSAHYSLGYHASHLGQDTLLS